MTYCLEKISVNFTRKFHSDHQGKDPPVTKAQPNCPNWSRIILDHPQLVQVQDTPSQTHTQLVLALLVLVLVSLCVIVSWSLLVLVAVLVLVWVWVLVGVLVLVMVAVTLVVGDPMSVMLMEMGSLCATIQARPAPRPSNISQNILNIIILCKKYFLTKKCGDGGEEWRNSGTQ